MLCTGGENSNKCCLSNTMYNWKGNFFFQASLRNCKNCDHNCEDHSCLHNVLILSSSFTTHLHLFHGNIWTQNWPAPNVSGFIAQLVERRTGIARSRVQAPLKSWIFFRLLYAIAKIAIITARIILHLISYPQFTYDLFHMHHSPWKWNWIGVWICLTLERNVVNTEPRRTAANRLYTCSYWRITIVPIL